MGLSGGPKVGGLSQYFLAKKLSIHGVHLPPLFGGYPVFWGLPLKKSQKSYGINEGAKIEGILTVMYTFWGPEGPITGKHGRKTAIYRPYKNSGDFTYKSA